MDVLRQKELESLLESLRSVGIGLVIAILVLAMGIRWVRSWFRDRDDPADNEDQLLDQIQEMHREGDLSDEEFRSIKSQLTGRQQTGVASPIIRDSNPV